MRDRLTVYLEGRREREREKERRKKGRDEGEGGNDVVVRSREDLD